MIKHNGALYVKAGKLSWKDVNELAKKYNGQLNKSYKSKSDAAQDTMWVFNEDEGTPDRKAFADELESKHMTFKVKPPGVIVWF